VLVRKNSGGVSPDGTTNHAIEFGASGSSNPEAVGLYLTVATVIPALRSSTDPNVKDAYERLRAALTEAKPETPA
jgi:hypothetical protein